MDQAGDSYGGQGAAEGKTGASIGGDSMAAPSPPVFGNANTNRIGGEGDFRGINLDDIFSGVFFTPDGELLDFSSDDDDDGHNVTFSSSSAVEGRTHPPFAQYAVLGDSPDATGGGDDSGHVEGVFMSSSRVKRRKIPKIQHGGESGSSTGESANPGLFEAPGGVGVGGALGGGLEIEMGATRAAEGTAGVLTVQPKPEYSPEGRCSAAEATGGTTGAAAEAATAAAAATEKARAAQDDAVSRAAAKAAEAHAQAQTHVQATGAATAEKPSPYARPTPAASNPLAALPTGGIMGPLATHGFRSTSAPLQAIGALSSRGEGAARGIRGITAVAPPNASLLAGGPRGRGVYAGGALPRRQRHKVSSKDLTEEQRNERRERNREHAKRSRVRKKFLLDSLQRSVDALQAENDSLKGSIVGSLGERGRELVAKFSPEDEAGTLVTANPTQATKILDDPDYSLVKALQTAQQNFVITDASLADNPIVFASSGFLELTRYTLTEVLGRNCRFLQGPETDPRAVDKIRMAIEEGCDTSVCLLNYRADGTTFWNQFFVAALRDGEGATVNYVGVQCKVGDDYARKVVAAQKKQLASLRAGAAAAAAAAKPSRGVQPSRSQPSLNQAAPGTAPASAAAAPSAAAGAGARHDGTQI